jgi:hypothetical protein
MISINYTIPEIVFSGNPVVLKFNNNGNDAGTVNVQIFHFERPNTCTPVLNAKYQVLGKKNGIDGKFAVDISSVLQSYVEHNETADPLHIANGETVGMSYFSEFEIVVHIVETDATIADDYVSVLYGGIDNRVLQEQKITSGEWINEHLVSVDTNYIENPILTMRTRGSSIHLYEEELRPLYFVGFVGSYGDPTVKINIKNCVNVVIFEQNLAIDSPRLICLNLASLVDEAHHYFKIYFNNDEDKAIHVSIEPTPPSRKKRLVTFLNSYGFYESILFWGKAEVSETADDSGDAGQTMRFDVDTQLFTKQGRRRELTKKITLRAGYSHPERQEVIRDMMRSERIYLSSTNYQVPSTIADMQEVICTTTELVMHTDDDRTGAREVEVTFENA